MEVKPAKGKAGRAKVVRMKEETMPTPQGRRVVPRVTSAMKAEANRKAGEGRRAGAKAKKVKVGFPPRWSGRARVRSPSRATLALCVYHSGMGRPGLGLQLTPGSAICFSDDFLVVLASSGTAHASDATWRI